MRGEYLVKVSRRGVKDYGNQNISAGLVVQPVHQQNERNKAEWEIQGMHKTRFDQITLIVVLDEGQRQMPKRPENRKDQGGIKEIEPAAQTIGPVRVPGQFLNDGRDEEQEPDRKDS